MCKQNLSRAEDLAQEGWIAIWRAIPTWEDGKGCSLDTWLKRKAEYAMLDVIRKDQTQSRSSYDTVSFDLVPEFVEDILGRAAALDEVEMAYHHGEIAATVNNLIPTYRKYIFLKFWAGMDHKDIVQEFGYCVNAVKRRSYKQLAKELAHLGSGQ